MWVGARTDGHLFTPHNKRTAIILEVNPTMQPEEQRIDVTFGDVRESTLAGR